MPKKLSGFFEKKASAKNFPAFLKKASAKNFPAFLKKSLGKKL
ncbi:hypothetical protein NSA36_06565 [Anaerotruncus colihominis]|nr:hypothetical protein [Anaerotruncus colihominis]